MSQVLRRRAKILALVCLGASFPAAAAMFNDVLPGARPMGMGMAYTAVSDDPYGMFYNPAGLAGGDFTQLDGTIGRMISPVGLLSFEAMTYTRPLPIMPGATVGAGFFTLRQNNGGDKDSFLLHFSDDLRVPQLYLSRPLQVGGNFKFINIDGPKGKRFGLGLDGGAILDSGMGLKIGASITDLDTALGVPNPSLNLGSSYLCNDWILFTADMRVRNGLTQFFPGMEMSFFEKLLKLRLGKGLPLDGVSQAAFGVGVNFSPLIIDFGMTVPFQGFNRPGGAYQLSFNYKFGAPSFYGRFVGTAARQAEDLRSEIFDLEQKRNAMQAQVAASEADKTSLEGQTRALEERARDLEERLRALDLKMDKTVYGAAHKSPEPAPAAPPPRPKPRPARAPAAKEPKVRSFPLQHTVVAGDTLRGIARVYYGDSNLWELIYDANPDKIERGLPVEGAVLTVPAPPKK